MQHVLPEGKAAIEAIAALGVSLEYLVEREYRVGVGAAVDLAFSLNDGSGASPLFIFEVESTAGSGVATNPLKVFGQDSADLERPLFFFHIVMAGSANNQRIQNAQRQWGVHNYRVYRFAEPDQRAALVQDVMKQHRRVRGEVNVMSLALALESPAFGGPDAARGHIEFLEQTGIRAHYLRDYALLAVRSSDYARLLAKRLLKSRSVVESELGDGGYGGAVDYMPGLIETAIAISSGEISDVEGPGYLEAWATSRSGGLRMLDASFGLSQDYDDFVVSHAPVHYALAYAALRDNLDSRLWVLEDFSGLLDRERASGLSPRLRLPAAAWLAHLIAAELERHGPKPEGLDSLYARVGEHVSEAGGFPASLILAPPGPFSLQDRDVATWLDEVDDVPFPGWTVLAKLSLDADEARARPRPSGLELALRSLVDFGCIFETSLIRSVVYGRD